MRPRPTPALLAILALLVGACSSSSHRATKRSASSTTTRSGRAGHGTRPTVVPRPDGGGRIHAVPTSIESTCRSDVTNALQSWIDELPDHVTVAFAHDGCYRIEGTVVLSRRDRLVLAGNGATLRATTPGTGGRLQKRSRSQLSIVRSHDIVVKNLIVRGANPHAGLADEAYQAALEAQHAFSLLGDDGVTLDAVQAYDVYGDFVYVGGSGDEPSRNVTIEHSRFARNGRQGISVTNGEGVRIVANTIDDVRRSLIDLEPNTRSGIARDIRIERNTTGRIRNYWLADKGVGANIGDVVASHNLMRAPSGALVIVVGPKFGRRGPFTFVANVLSTDATVTDEKAAGAFLFVNVTGVTVRDNRVSMPASARLAGLDLRSTDRVAVSGNVFSGATEPVHADPASRLAR